MGFSVTFATVPLAQKDVFLQAAGVVVSDEADPDGQGVISATTYKDHFLIWRNLRKVSFFSEPDWVQLSEAAAITALDVVDTAGAQVLRYFEGGKELWSVSFEDRNEDFLSLKGPVSFDVDALRSDLRAKWLTQHPEDAEEDDADLIAGYGMEIPSRLFEQATEHYYEDGPPEGLCALSGDMPLIKLGWTGQPTDPKKPWWKIW